MCCSGAPLPPGVTYCSSTLCPVSDRAQKRDIEPIDPDQVLERVRAMPISTWSYIDMDDGARHIGPMAQDFSAAFNVGASDRCIATVDANGVALAAIQALARQVDELREDNHALRSEMVRLRRADRRARGRLRPR